MTWNKNMDDAPRDGTKIKGVERVMDYTKAKIALENIDTNWKAHCDLHDIDYPEYEDMQLIKLDMKEVKDALNYKALRQKLPMENLLTAQIDKICDMALDPECCMEYLKKSIQIIQGVNRQRAQLSTEEKKDDEVIYASLPCRWSKKEGIKCDGLRGECPHSCDDTGEQWTKCKPYEDKDAAAQPPEVEG